MAKLLYSVTMSADGFIAGPGGDMSWLTEHLGADPVMDELIAGVGALLVGARTFGGDDPHRGDPEREGAFEGEWDGPQVVLTHRPPAQPVTRTTFLDDVRTAVEAARDAAGGKEYVNVLGADVARQCLELGALDEVLTCVAPVFLGDGTRLFERPGGTRVGLERIRQWHTPRTTNSWYRVV
ncbi:dihydrofolate reductase family protein [Georgenia halophila]|uniref:Dihydrofolate reductase family protein n=1 Tax=Georgenia halophila TaxID=620889 RepID=A0ABP8LJE5_9MICO